MKKNKDLLIGITECMDDNELVHLHNTYCTEGVNMYDSCIYENNDLEEYFPTMDSLARAIYYGEFNYMDKWFTFNGYGNIVTFDSFDLSDHIETDEIVEYVLESEEGDYVFDLMSEYWDKYYDDNEGV